MLKTKDHSLLIGLAIPVILLIGAILLVLIPNMFARPAYDFLYAVNNDYNYSPNYFDVENGRLVKRTNTPSPGYTLPVKDPTLYIHRTATNKNEKVTFESAQQLFLDDGKESPDGYRVANGTRDEGFFPFFWSSSTDYDARYLKGHGASKKLSLETGRPYSYNFVFLGWITSTP